MSLLRLPLLAVILSGLPACAPLEPAGGCVLAAANERAALRYLHPSIPARILAVHFAGARIGHAVLIYHLDGGWWAYDDSAFSRPLHVGNEAAFPDPLVAGRSAFPLRMIDGAAWLDPER